MNSDSDPPFPPMMSTAEMLNTFETDLDGSMQPADGFFDSALSTESSERLFSDDALTNPLFPSVEPAKMQALQDPTDTARSRQPISTSPESSLQDSSSDSSGHRKRKSSSKSSQSGLSAVDSPMAHGLPSDSWKHTPGSIKREPTFNTFSASTPNFDSYEFNPRAGGDFVDFGSAGSSPSHEAASHAAPYSGPRHVAIQYQDSPMSTASFLVNNPTNTRETSPISNPANLGQPTRPSRLRAPEESVDNALLRGMEQRSWPFGEDVQHGLPNLAALGRPSAFSNPAQSQPMPDASYPPAPSCKPTLIVQPTPQKSRVETQIPIKLSLFPLPKGVTKLHLPANTISKPKLLARPPPLPSPDTLELHTMLVCTSAMHDPTKLRRALFKATNPCFQSSEDKRRLSTGDRGDKDDEEQPLNGGEVRICEGCIVRERKRAARKKSKKPEEEEPWQKDEGKRVVVFNTNEIKEWQPLQRSNAMDGRPEGNRFQKDGRGIDLPEGAMQVDIPMRIACYCRHQNEKLGFQVILTIKDYRGQLVSQTITNSILITDDHKTHPAPASMQPNGPLFGDQGEMPSNPVYPQTPLESYGPGLYRNAHSTTDLQSLQQSFNPQFMPHGMTPYAMPQNSSHTTSTTMPPRNLSRQASPSAPGGPVHKKRKASGGVNRVPNHLTMTRLQTEPSASESQWAAPASASSVAPSPYTPVFPPGSGPQTQPPSQAHHVPQRSGHFGIGPQAPSGQEVGILSQANRSQSFENFGAMPQMYSAPPSALPSRAPSPSGGLQMTNAVGPTFAMSQAQTVFPANDLSHQRAPVIHKLIPSEGPKAGGIEVTCLGSGFHQGLEVMFGDSLATTTTYWGENSLVCLLPPALRAGTVPVTFKHQFQQQQHQAQFARYPSPPLSKPQTLFKYVDDDEQELMRQALLIVSQKMRGDVSDAGQVARWIVNGTSSAGQGSWSGAQQGSGGGHLRQASNGQGYLASAVDCEGAVLKCLELIDLDESPFPARLNLRKQNDQTLLHLAASLGYHRLVAGLLVRGANPDSRDKNGMSPMHMAALNGHAQIVRRLRVSGADSTLRSLSGYTPADMATSQAVLDAVETLSLPRSRSADPMSMWLSHSRTHSSYLASSLLPAPVAVGSDTDDASSEEGDDEDSDTPEDSADIDTMPTQAWTRSRRNSTAAAPNLETTDLDNSHGYMFAVAAMAAWRDQIAAQLQQFQHNVNFTLPNLPALPPLPTLPPMPNLPYLPDYQAYPMVRRFSSFVPHRNSRPSSSAGREIDSKESDSKWWEFLTGVNSPPAYEEIYPGKAQPDLDTKTESAARAAAEAAADQKCTTIYDTDAPSASSARRPPHTLSAREEDELRLLQRKNVKRLRSDSKLFLIWIPLLVLVMAAMLKDRVPELFHITKRVLEAVSERYHGRDVAVEAN